MQDENMDRKSDAQLREEHVARLTHDPDEETEQSVSAMYEEDYKRRLAREAEIIDRYIGTKLEEE